MKPVIDNNQSKFLLTGKSWNTQTYVCNMGDIAKCAKEFDVNQPYTISRLWNGEFKKLTVKKVIELLEANQLDASFFKKTKPVYAGSISNY
jgi:hypothetical protein